MNVEAAKELIMETDVPYIINRGRKGGSNVAAAICNALLYELKKNELNNDLKGTQDNRRDGVDRG